MASYSSTVVASTNWIANDEELSKVLRLQTRSKQDISNRGVVHLQDGNVLELKSPDDTNEGKLSCSVILDLISNGVNLMLFSISVVSESRTVELYGDSDSYIGTAQGYSLQDKSVLQSEDRSSIESNVSSYPGVHPPSLPADSIDALPMDLQAIVSTLRNLRPEQPNGSAQVPTGSSERPGEVVMAMTMLKNMHSVMQRDQVESTSDANGSTSHGERSHGSPSDTAVSTKPAADVGVGVQDSSSATEGQSIAPSPPHPSSVTSVFATKQDLLDLQRHFDDALSSLRTHVDTRMDQILSNLQSLTPNETS